MKKISLLLCTLILVFSCSSDNEDDSGNNENGTNDLVGTWVLTDLRVDSTTDNDDLDFAKEIIGFLQGIDCDLIIFTFNADGTAVSDSKADFLSINVGVGGLDIPCPTESTTESTTWSLEGNQLTFINEDMEEETITIAFEDGNILIIPGESIDENNYAGADAVFTKQ
ncbi:lipocalin family protein [Flagellimonas allohymeniacidonis]|uniref:Uncharacterized protein n=1 Tax=Flagellimonas allohymeniacidonis TaxID=2517819 RepID=A0A4Q8Q9W3_9FLAO|nr:lipocalin family protein [Allomuricauda hymeniacidonis]TAI47072.1 hypothetical protein EW142_10285 [Allomuricauda hymeniacidonis]